MGLDISAYRGLVPATDLTFDVSGEPEGDAWWNTHARVSGNADVFAGREAPLTPGFYTFADSMSFRAGSYGGYNEWRERLAKLAGYAAQNIGRHGHSEGAWAATGGPFWELIHFTDCDGTIGPDAARKLAADFAEFDDRAKAATPDEPWFYDLYQSWRRAFEMAADGGCVEFH